MMFLCWRSRLDFITITSEWCTYARANRNIYAALAACVFQRRFLLNSFRMWHHLTRHASQQPISDREHYRMWQNISVLMRIKIMVGIWKHCFRTQRQSFKSVGSVRHAMSLSTLCSWKTSSVSSTGTEGQPEISELRPICLWFLQRSGWVFPNRLVLWRNGCGVFSSSSSSSSCICSSSSLCYCCCCFLRFCLLRSVLL